MRYVLQFIEADGLLQLLDMIAAMDYKGRQTREHLNAIKCISSLMNNAHGLKCVLSHPNSEFRVRIDDHVLLLSRVTYTNMQCSRPAAM